jgi:WD40 repeat protein
VLADNAIAPADDDLDPGAFVANDAMDEGVELVLRLKHAALHEESASSPGARSRRSPIKVICLARCPRGGHFATGADDGVCRVWRDLDDPLVEKVDSQFFADSDRHPSSCSARHGSMEGKHFQSRTV